MPRRVAKNLIARRINVSQSANALDVRARASVVRALRVVPFIAASSRWFRTLQRLAWAPPFPRKCRFFLLAIQVFVAAITCGQASLLRSPCGPRAHSARRGLAVQERVLGAWHVSVQARSDSLAARAGGRGPRAEGAG